MSLSVDPLSIILSADVPALRQEGVDLHQQPSAFAGILENTSSLIKVVPSLVTEWPSLSTKGIDESTEQDHSQDTHLLNQINQLFLKGSGEDLKDIDTRPLLIPSRILTEGNEDVIGKLGHDERCPNKNDPWSVQTKTVVPLGQSAVPSLTIDKPQAEKSESELLENESSLIGLEAHKAHFSPQEQSLESDVKISPKRTSQFILQNLAPEFTAERGLLLSAHGPELSDEKEGDLDPKPGINKSNVQNQDVGEGGTLKGSHHVLLLSKLINLPDTDFVHSTSSNDTNIQKEISIVSGNVVVLSGLPNDKRVSKELQDQPLLSVDDSEIEKFDPQAIKVTKDYTNRFTEESFKQESKPVFTERTASHEAREIHKPSFSDVTISESLKADPSDRPVLLTRETEESTSKNTEILTQEVRVKPVAQAVDKLEPLLKDMGLQTKEVEDHTARHLLGELRTSLQTGKDRMHIRFDPPELGKFSVKLDFSAEGQVRAIIVVDKPETYEFLTRNPDGLRQALESSGLKSEMQFDLKDQGSANQGKDFSGSNHLNDRPQDHKSSSQERRSQATTMQEIELLIADDQSEEISVLGRYDIRV